MPDQQATLHIISEIAQLSLSRLTRIDSYRH